MSPSPANDDFDQYACSYDRALAEGLSVSGEDRQYFANGRVNWLAACIRRIGFHPRSLMDYGCGTGSTVELLLRTLDANSIVGLDTSDQCLEVARKICAAQNTEFALVNSYVPCGRVDLAYCNGVFHHIAPEQRLDCLDFIRRSLRPEGLFAFWENNPWNPGTRYIMSRVSFDRDAITLSPVEAYRLLRSAGFQVLRTDFLFIFPRALKLLRPVEKVVSRVPLGGQYQILCQNTSLGDK